MNVKEHTETIAPEEVTAFVREKWGWESPDEWTLKFAKLCLDVKLGIIRTGDLLVNEGLLTEKEVKDALKTQPKKIPFYEHLLNTHPDKSSLSGRRNYILAIQKGLIHIDDVKRFFIDVHPDMQNSEIYRFCDDHHCTLMLIEGRTPLLLFGEVTSTLDDIRTLHGTTRSQHPIYSRFEDVKLGISEPSIIAMLLSSAKSGELGIDAQNSIREGELLSERSRKKLATVFDYAVRMRSTDIHIEPFYHEDLVRVRLRTNTWLKDCPPHMWLKREEYQSIKRLLMDKSNAATSGEEIVEPRDGAFTYLKQNMTIQVRCAFMPLGHESIVTDNLVAMRLRLLVGNEKPSPIYLDKMGVSNIAVTAMRSAMRFKKGMILMVGPTNSGKSTSCLGMVQANVDAYGDSISRLSIEDPVERKVPGIQQIQISHAMRKDPQRFEKYLSSLVRMDPDFLFIGEIRDGITAILGVDAATTGHLVLATLHADTTTLGVKRIVNMITDPDKRFLAIQAIEHVFSQRIMPKVCPSCFVEHTPTPEQIEQFEELCQEGGDGNLTLPAVVADINPEGCNECQNTGVVGVVPINEHLRLGPKERDLLLGNDPDAFAKLNSCRTMTLMQEVTEQLHRKTVPLRAILGD